MTIQCKSIRMSRMFLVLAFACIPAVNPLAGQSKEENYPDSFADEVIGTNFEKSAEPMKNFIRMIEVDGQIQLLDNWDKADARATRDNKPDPEFEARVEEMMDSGMDRETAERFAEAHGRGNTKGMLGEFVKIRSAFGPSGGSGGSQGGKEWDYRIRTGQFGGHTRKDNRSTRIQFYDYENDIDFYINKKSEGVGFQFRFFSAHGFIDLWQSEDEIRLIVIQAGIPEVVSADNFRELMEQSPQVLREQLLPLWRALGIRAPMNLSDKRVVDAALQKIEAFNNDEMLVQGLLQDLTGDSMSTRNEAYEELLEGYFNWRELIEKFKSELELDEVSRPKLNLITTAAPGTMEQDYLDQLDLLNNKNALQELLKHTPEGQKNLVSDQIKFLEENKE